MENINPLYHNSYGVAFQFKRNCAQNMGKVQLVFRDTGLFFSHQELKEFSGCISKTLESSQLCSNCSQDKNCKALLLETPISQLSFAMSLYELKALKELVEGTLFHLGLDHMLREI